MLSKKQIQSLNDSDARINIWEGAVRSGKTYVSLWRFLKELTFGPEGEYCIIARTYDAFKRNILPNLMRMIGADAQYYSGKRELNIWGKTIHIIGADDERAESKIRGPTFAGSYVDEATIIPESVFKMLISRCCMGQAKIFATTNPDSPYHWLKKDFLTDNADVKSWQFRLDDNPELTADEKEYLRRQYKGLWFQRFIEGLWVQAEGAIYDTFDTKMHVIDFPPGMPSYSIIGVDYGTSNPTAFTCVSVNTSKFPNMWVDDIYFYDSRSHQRQKTDTEYAADLAKFISGKPVRAIYIDPSAASFKLECSRHNIPNLYDAENEVLDGIRLVGNYINNGTLKICRNCDHLIKEFQSYVWDSRAAITGVDKPMKQNDHCVIGETLISTEMGYERIDSLVGKDGLVKSYARSARVELPGTPLTITVGIPCMVPYGDVRLTRKKAAVMTIKINSGKSLTATLDHKILVNSFPGDYQWVEMKNLKIGQSIFVEGSPYLLLEQIVEIALSGEADVYCLKVPATENFIANGIVVHNCLDSLRYAMYTHFYNKAGTSMSPNDLDRLYADSMGLGSNLPAPFRDVEYR